MTGINFDDGTYYSEDNIWFSSSKYKPVDFGSYTRPLLASNRSSIGNLKLVFQSSALKDKYESKIASQGPLLKDVWISDKFGDNEEAFDKNSKYLNIKQSVVYWAGDNGLPPEDIGINSGVQNIPWTTLLYQSVKGAAFKLPVL